MNPWAVPSLIALFVSLYLGIYVIYKNPKSLINRVFFLLTLFSACWFAIEFIIYFVPYSAGVQLIKVEWICRTFAVAFALNFALVFPKKRKRLAQKWGYFVLFTPAIIVSILIYYFIRGVETFYWGFAPSYTFAVGIYLVYASISLLGMLFLFIYVYRHPRVSIEKDQVRWPIIGVSLIILYNVICTFIIVTWGFYPGPELNNILFIIVMATFSVAILKYKLFIIEPTSENEIETPQKYPLEKGLSYLVKEEKFDKSYEIFYDQVTHGISGLSITKLPPEKVRERYRITKSPILWLTFKEVENAFSPKDIEGLKYAVSDFVGKTEKTVILLDCFDQTILANGFEKSMSMLKGIKDICRKNNANLLLSINPEMFEKEQIAMIEKELKEIKVQHG